MEIHKKSIADKEEEKRRKE